MCRKNLLTLSWSVGDRLRKLSQIMWESAHQFFVLRFRNHDKSPKKGNSKLEFVSFKAAADGKLEKIEGQGFQMTELTLRPKLVIANARDAERASRILEKSEKHCLISNSIKTAVRLEPEIEVAELVA